MKLSLALNKLQGELNTNGSYYTFLKFIRLLHRPITNKLKVAIIKRNVISKLIRIGRFKTGFSNTNNSNKAVLAYSLIVASKKIDIFGDLYTVEELHSSSNYNVGECFGTDIDIKVFLEYTRYNFFPSLFYGLLELDDEKSKFIESAINYYIDELICDETIKVKYWKCPMDVSIRMINLIYCLDLISNKKEYEIIKINLARCINSCYEFVVLNQEFNYKKSNNHYLVNLLAVNLFNICLPRTMFGEVLSKHYRIKLYKEITRQFNKDGSNFEDSTAYHRFVVEGIRIIYPLIIRKHVGKKEQALVNSINGLMKDASYFSQTITVSDGTYPVIGDNDSGYIIDLFKDIRILNDEIIGEVWSAIELNSNILVQSVHDENFKNRTDSHVGNNSNCINKKTNHNKPNNTNMIKCIKKTKREIAYQIDFDSDYSIHDFEGFGLIVARNDKEFFSLKYKIKACGHSHNDLSSITLYNYIQGWIISDPGVDRYTSSWNLRQKYRTSGVHFAPVIMRGEKINEYRRFTDWFEVEGKPTKHSHEKYKDRLVITYWDDMNKITRDVCFSGKRIVINDKIEGPDFLVKPSVVERFERYSCSQGLNNYSDCNIYG